MALLGWTLRWQQLSIVQPVALSDFVGVWSKAVWTQHYNMAIVGATEPVP